MTQNIVTRFAPSPTGRLHLGHAYSAMLAHDRARATGGRFLLRIEDIDGGRCRAEFVDGILEDLRWLGLEWDGEVMVQSARGDVYAAALQRLIEGGFAYRCWCTRAEIAASAGAPQGDEGPLYPGTCKGRADPGDGRSFCWRLDVAAACDAVGPLIWCDQDAPHVAADPASLGDVVIARKDAATSYHMAVTIDDAAQGVTDVVRGRDLFASTHIHRLLQALLGLPTPRYHHHALILDENGERLAKRRGSISIADLRASDTDPLQLIGGMREGRFPVGFGLEAA
jgi:glutamyl-Q tRNA(Asp) synthetase